MHDWRRRRWSNRFWRWWWGINLLFIYISRFLCVSVSRCFGDDAELRTFFVALADLDDFVNVFLLECSSDDNEVVLSLLVVAHC